MWHQCSLGIAWVLNSTSQPENLNLNIQISIFTDYNFQLQLILSGLKIKTQLSFYSKVKAISKSRCRISTILLVLGIAITIISEQLCPIVTQASSMLQKLNWKTTLMQNITNKELYTEKFFTWIFLFLRNKCRFLHLLRRESTFFWIPWVMDNENSLGFLPSQIITYTQRIYNLSAYCWKWSSHVSTTEIQK